MIPPGLTFKQAIQKGYIKPIRNKAYTDWVKSLPCCVCGKQSDDPHHIIQAGYGGKGTKASDLWTIPLCREHHDELHKDVDAWEFAHGMQFEFVALTLLQAVHDGILDL